MNLYERVWIVDYIKCSLMLIMIYGLFYEVSVKYMNCMKSLFDLGYHIRDRNKKKDQKGLFAVCHAVRAHGKADVHVVCRRHTFFYRASRLAHGEVFAVCPWKGSRQRRCLPALDCHGRFAVCNTAFAVWLRHTANVRPPVVM